jgi:hypothetical protein
MGLPVRVWLMLILRMEGGSCSFASSLSGSSASAMFSAEKGFSSVAALGLRMFFSFARPTKGEVFLGRAALLAVTALIGVAGASCGAEAAAWRAGGTGAPRLTTLTIAGSTKGLGEGAEGAEAGAGSD